jgi:nucleoside-diphosphate-sugar epimerase
MPSFLVTGATGFIGSHVVRELIKMNFEVYALVRHESNLWRIEDVKDKIKKIQYDIFDSEKLKKIVRDIGPNIIIHLAWYVEPGKYLNSIKNIDYIRASVELAKIAKEINCQKFVSVGSCFEYDLEEKYISENTKLSPNTLYSASKIATFYALKEIFNNSSTKFVWARLFYLFGPYEDERRFVPYIISSLLKNEEVLLTDCLQVRDYLFIEDCSKIIVKISLSDFEGEINIGSGIPITLKEIALMIGKKLNRVEKLKIGAKARPPNDPPFVCAKIEKLKSIFPEFIPENLESAIDKTIAWWKNKYNF